MNTRPRLAVVAGFGSLLTGQQRAIELLAAGLSARGWDVRMIPTPLLDRAATPSRRVLMLPWLALRLLGAWLRAGATLAAGRTFVVSPGLTRFGLVRDGLPLMAAGLLGRRRGLIWLQGSTLVAWQRNDLTARLLRAAARGARRVAVLGRRQEEALLRLGIPAGRIARAENTTEIATLPAAECVAKQRRVAAGEPLRVLFLSNLIPSKGYPEFLDALALLAAGETPIRATLCGRVMSTGENRRFGGSGADRGADAGAEAWIRTRISTINRSPAVRVEWVQGAYGEEKERLYRAAHLFVLPTAYPVEAQPLTVLEALACGCAVITTRAGEIPDTLPPGTAVLLDAATPESVAAAVAALAADHAQRTTLALAGLQLFDRRYSYARHLDRWEALLGC